MSTSRTTYLPRWSSQLTEQLLSYKPGSPSPPPPPPPPPNDSGTASIVVDIPIQENGKQKTSSPPIQAAATDSEQCQDNNGDDHHPYPHSIPELWSQLAQQIPSQQQHQPKKKIGRISPTTTDPGLEKQGGGGGISLSSHHNQHHDSWSPDNDSIMNENERWPLGLILFWLGFLCPLLWWVGSFWPRHADRIGKMTHRWQWINRIMSITFCIILFLFLLAIGIWYHFSSP